MLKIYATVFAGALLLGGGVAGAMTLSVSSGPPQGGILLSRDVAGDAGSYDCDRGLGAESLVGQTFRLSEVAELARITLRVRPVTDVSATHLILHFGTFSSPTDATMDQLVASEIGLLPATLPVGETTYLTFDIADRQLGAGTQYGFVVGFAGGDHPGEARLDVLHAGANVYAGGLAVEWSGLQENALANDLVFYLQGTGGTDGEPAPEDDWIESDDLPGFEAQVRITPAGAAALDGAGESNCIAETLCASGALAGRPEIFVKVIGPRPNGYLWVQLIRFTPSAVEVWLRQKQTDEVNHYVLPAVPDEGTLPGLEDRTAFLP